MRPPVQCLPKNRPRQKNPPFHTTQSVLTGTVSPVSNYLKVVAFKSPWCWHMAPDIKSFFNCLFNFWWACKVLMLKLQNHSKLSFLFWMRLELLLAYSNLLNAHSKYGVSSSIYITKADCVTLQVCRHLYDKIEQLPPYFECALSNFRDILNAHRATLGASMIEQVKNAPNWETANKIRLSCY